jgi:hypothetical protein
MTIVIDTHADSQYEGKQLLFFAVKECVGDGTVYAISCKEVQENGRLFFQIFYKDIAFITLTEAK